MWHMSLAKTSIEPVNTEIIWSHWSTGKELCFNLIIYNLDRKEQHKTVN